MVANSLHISDSGSDHAQQSLRSKCGEFGYFSLNFSQLEAINERIHDGRYEQKLHGYEVLEDLV